MSSISLLGVLFWRLNMGVKDKQFKENLMELTMRIRKVKYKEISAGKQMY